jgi:hypothetical protein
MGLRDTRAGSRPGATAGLFAPLGAWWVMLASLAVAFVGAPRELQTPALAAPDDGPIAVERVIQALSDSSVSLDEAALGALQQEGFRLFMDRMAAKDGPSSVGLARAMHARAGATWSAFCLEGALRRSAPADASGPSAQEAYAEADRVLSALLRQEGLSPVDRLAVVQRRAILAAGFGDASGELSSLGRALGMGGIDGAQILGLRALAAGDHEEAARLFGLLLDRGDLPQDRPWALRGHGLAALEHLRQGS